MPGKSFALVLRKMQEEEEAYPTRNLEVILFSTAFTENVSVHGEESTEVRKEDVPYWIGEHDKRKAHHFLGVWEDEK